MVCVAFAPLPPTETRVAGSGTWYYTRAVHDMSRLNARATPCCVCTIKLLSSLSRAQMVSQLLSRHQEQQQLQLCPWTF